MLEVRTKKLYRKEWSKYSKHRHIAYIENDRIDRTIEPTKKGFDYNISFY